MYHSHNHGHSHDHSHDDTCNSNDVTLSDVNIDADDVQPTDDVPSATVLFNAVRYGLKIQVQSILKTAPDIVNNLDPQGHSCVHWAAKRGDIEMLQILYDYGANLGIPTDSEARMLPIHWAASDGKISSLRFLIDKRQDINAQDGNGCSPVIIATQHNHPTCVIFLIKNGADTTLRDGNGDTALHWAAYKGFVEMVGLLTYCMPHFLNSDDTFGQTPLHLAALRGNEGVVEYLVVDCGADVGKKDRNGLTALELSAKKSQLKSEWTLRRLTSKGICGVLRGLKAERLKDNRVLSFLFCGSNERELSLWPWRIVFASNFVGSIVTMYFATDEHMADLYYLHLFNTMVQVVWWIMFTMCLIKSPSYVRDDPSGRGPTYDKALAAIGLSDSDDAHVPPVCHTCHVCRPLRSKHCKIARRCVNKFDHFCPFVGNTVGRDNYKFFIGLLCTHVVAGIAWVVTAFWLRARTRISWLLFLFTIYSLAWMLMIFCLLSYHLQLITKNLTTNEHIGLSKYAYLRNAFNVMDNPYDRGSVLGNILSGLFPSTKVHYSRKEAEIDRNSEDGGCGLFEVETVGGGAGAGGAGASVGSSNSTRGNEQMEERLALLEAGQAGQFV